MKRIHNFSFPVLCFILSFLLSCEKSEDRKTTFFYDFDQEGMIPGFEYVFYPFEDSLELRNKNNNFLDLKIRYSDKCNIRTLPLNLEISSLQRDTLQTISIEVPLFNEEDSMEGKGNFGVYETSLPLLKNVPVEESFFVSVFTPETKTQGILSIGIVCKNLNSNRNETDFR